jgi:hypothetical protein
MYYNDPLRRPVGFRFLYYDFKLLVTYLFWSWTREGTCNSEAECPTREPSMDLFCIVDGIPGTDYGVSWMRIQLGVLAVGEAMDRAERMKGARRPQGCEYIGIESLVSDPHLGCLTASKLVTR